MSQDHAPSGNPYRSLQEVVGRMIVWAAPLRCYLGLPEPRKYSEREIYCEEFKLGAGRRPPTGISNRSACAFRRRWSWVLALLPLVVAAPARANGACSGGDDDVARPIAATLQPNASVFDPAGRFKVTLHKSTDLTSEIDLRHMMGGRVLFRTVTKLQAELHTVIVERLPRREGLGFALRVTLGGSGVDVVCSYGFRFQNGVVFYRTLAAKLTSSGIDEEGRRHRETFVGDVTEWKPALERPLSPTVGSEPLGSLSYGERPEVLAESLAAAHGVAEARAIDYAIAHALVFALSQVPDAMSRQLSAEMSADSFAALLLTRMKMQDFRVIPSDSAGMLDFAIKVAVAAVDAVLLERLGVDERVRQVIRDHTVPAWQVATGRYPQALVGEILLVTKNLFQITVSAFAYAAELRAQQESERQRALMEQQGMPKRTQPR